MSRKTEVSIDKEIDNCFFLAPARMKNAVAALDSTMSEKSLLDI